MRYSHLEAAELTDVGRRRQRNEDAVLCLKEQGVFALADGMGGVVGGDLASRLTMTTLREELVTSDGAFSGAELPSRLRAVAEAVNKASKRIREEADSMGAVGTGTTVLLLVFDPRQPGRAASLHAGDSRLYRFRSGELERLTEDHSIAAEIGADDESSLPPIFRGVITRAVGLADATLLERTKIDVCGNDLFLLCSDGLSKMVPKRGLCRLLAEAGQEQLEATARKLVDAANRAGGEDNISVVLVRVATELPPAEPVADEPPPGEARAAPLSVLSTRTVARTVPGRRGTRPGRLSGCTSGRQRRGPPPASLQRGGARRQSPPSITSNLRVVWMATDGPRGRGRFQTLWDGEQLHVVTFAGAPEAVGDVLGLGRRRCPLWITVPGGERVPDARSEEPACRSRSPVHKRHGTVRSFALDILK